MMTRLEEKSRVRFHSSSRVVWFLPQREKCFDDDKHADAEGMEIICMYMDMELNKHSKGTVQNWNL